ncbi:MAG: tyrosine-type recombinase/integrase [Deltaproteobacteria bacterium]|nr:MAG: tyrosine-type recombinase/integrase [Deltaproteobacteria bacterium]
MNITDSIINYRRYLKRRNCSANTVRSYLSNLKQFVLWLDEPIEQVSYKKITAYVDYLLGKRLAPKTINCHLVSIHGFYNYLHDQQELKITNPVKKGYHLRLARPLPKHLQDEQVAGLFSAIKSRRDRAMFMLMLRCGLRVAEVAILTIDAIDWRRRRIYVYHGKGGKDRVVYISDDTYTALVAYVKQRLGSRVKKIFLVEKGVHKARPISTRGIRKRIEYYSKKSGVNVSCHQLRHTMATQLLNADADLVTIQDLLGHTRIKTTQRYCRVCNLKVQRDYFKAMAVVMRRSAGPSA